MHPKRKQRLILVLFVVLVSSVGVSLTLYALNENINLFYPPTKIVNGEAPSGRTIRAGGCVVPGTVTRAKDNLEIDFDVTDGVSELSVTYDGILPDLFAEGEAVVLTGMLDNDGVFVATKVLAKHDENYMPPEVADTVTTDGAEHMKTCKGISYDS
ncbi:cytochrome c maturation protein CcmE [Teredinibacter turnerae]|uniref:cytochrome c maturation protein CcmE n=1 Tax=Teredinibacter turnerae TaxID=2426 RepID=UPI000360FA2C|nr:cytochrome c maturation protein CcmE [Teredinibacter turnerae]